MSYLLKQPTEYAKRSSESYRKYYLILLTSDQKDIEKKVSKNQEISSEMLKCSLSTI